MNQQKLEQKFIRQITEELPSVPAPLVRRVLSHLLGMDLIPDKKVRQYYIVRQYPKEVALATSKAEVVASLGNATGLGDTQVYSIISNSSRMFEHKKRGPKPS